jgi:hypothetical protein
MSLEQLLAIIRMEEDRGEHKRVGRRSPLRPRAQRAPTA